MTDRTGDSGPDRIASLDLIRGIAVLGILTINIAGFAGPSAAALSPNLPSPGSETDEWVFAINMVLFEGKMRALFTMLFGASLALFIERADAKGAFGDLLQLRRLGWLMLIGLLHFYLLWWGDILFLYALAGIVVLFMRQLSIRTLLVSAVAIFTIWHATGAAMGLQEVKAETQVLNGTADAQTAATYDEYQEAVEETAELDLARIRSGFADRLADVLAFDALTPLETAFTSFGETLPLMLIGLVLYRTGFFSGEWSRARLWLLAIAGTIAGLAVTVPIVLHCWRLGFPPATMTAALLYWTAPGHLLMASGYAAMLVLAAPRLSRIASGRLLIAAGRCAFSNYLGTTLVMTALFYGWGLGLAGTVDRAGQWAFVLSGWALMLAWSAPWLRHFRRGPLEWIWRCAVEGRILQNRR